MWLGIGCYIPHTTFVVFFLCLCVKPCTRTFSGQSDHDCLRVMCLSAGTWVSTTQSYGWMQVYVDNCRQGLPVNSSRDRVKFELSSTYIRIYFHVLPRVVQTVNVCERCYGVFLDFEYNYLVCTPIHESNRKRPIPVYYRRELRSEATNPDLLCN